MLGQYEPRIRRVLEHEKICNDLPKFEKWVGLMNCDKLKRKQTNLLISPSPCRFGRGWASSHCRSAIWSPPLADSCKATHVRVTHTRWCWEDRKMERVSALDCVVKRIPLSSKRTYGSYGISHDNDKLSNKEDSGSFQMKVQLQKHCKHAFGGRSLSSTPRSWRHHECPPRILTTAQTKLVYTTLPVQMSGYFHTAPARHVWVV